MRVVITGATSGLGREMAVQLARRGWKVAVTGRRRELLEETVRLVERAGGEGLALVGSVTELSEVKAHYAQVKAKWGGLDWLILNAGVGDQVDAKEISVDNYRWTYETNVFGAVNWMEAVIPDMLAAKSGVIAGISSLAAYRGLPKSGSYSSSKAALNTLLESTRVDLHGTGVDVVTVCPGFVKSEMTDRNPPGSMPFLMSTEDGAAAVISGVERRRRIVHFPWQLSFLQKYVVSRIPGFLYDPVAARFAHLRKKRPSRPGAAKSPTSSPPR